MNSGLIPPRPPAISPTSLTDISNSFCIFHMLSIFIQQYYSYVGLRSSKPSGCRKIIVAVNAASRILNYSFDILKDIRGSMA